MPDIPTTEPSVVIAGDTLKWTKSLADYPADTYTLSYVLHLENSVAESPITFDASADGTDHSITVAAATTASWSAGAYVWTSYATTGSERYTVETGRLTIKPNPASITAGTDLRSHTKKVLDAIESVLEGRASLDQEEMQIDGQSLKRTPIRDLLDLRSRYLALYRQELNEEAAEAGRRSGGRYFMRL